MTPPIVDHPAPLTPAQAALYDALAARYGRVVFREMWLQAHCHGARTVRQLTNEQAVEALAALTGRAA